MTENELRNYIEELADKPTWWVDDGKSKYFDIVEFGLALAEVVRKAERERCAKLVGHILLEGGGTYGDKIRGE